MMGAASPPVPFHLATFPAEWKVGRVSDGQILT